MSDNPSLKKCPYCAEEILAEAIKCRYCGSDLTGKAPEAPAQAEAAPKKKSSMIWILIVLILLGCAIVWAISSSSGGSQTFSGGSGLDAPNSPVTYDVIYVVNGSAEMVNLTYSNATGDTEQHSALLPWSRTLTLRLGDFMYVSAQNDDDSGTVHCEIKVDGVVVEAATSSSAYGIATCSGSVGDD